MSIFSKKIVFDVGENIIGLRSTNGRYRSYKNAKRAIAIKRLESAFEIISYNGIRYDIPQIHKLSMKLLGRPFLPSGSHTDMNQVCWPGILGSSLDNTFKDFIGTRYSFPDTHEGSCQADVYKTLMLWRKYCKTY